MSQHFAQRVSTDALRRGYCEAGLTSKQNAIPNPYPLADIRVHGGLASKSTSRHFRDRKRSCPDLNGGQPTANIKQSQPCHIRSSPVAATQPSNIWRTAEDLSRPFGFDLRMSAGAAT